MLENKVNQISLKATAAGWRRPLCEPRADANQRDARTRSRRTGQALIAPSDGYVRAIAAPHRTRVTRQIARSAVRRFRQTRTPAIVRPVTKQTQEETVRQEPSRLAPRSNS